MLADGLAMPFKVSSRTVFLLGADLISSDGIAFYELIKNAFDARSPDVDLEVVVRIPTVVYAEQLRLLREARARSGRGSGPLLEWRETVSRVIDSTAPRAEQLRERLSDAASLAELEAQLERANFIRIRDRGVGMSAGDLDDVYLTIGTPVRHRQKEARRATGTSASDDAKPILGEKGVGRLAAMRLGSHLRVRTTQAGEAQWNILEIDWNEFLKDLDKELKDIPVKPTAGNAKKDRREHGTNIRIWGLAGDWTKDRLRSIVTHELSKLNDPFQPTSFPVNVSFNDETIAIQRLDEILFAHATADCSAEFVVDGFETRLEGTINYRYRNRQRAFKLDGPHLVSTVKAPSFEALNAVGSFRVQFYWFNRKLLREMEGIGEVRAVVNELQDRWAGGLMVYRDGFRVNPYGSPDDDWLNLDPKALGSAGYKVNRRQIVGKVDISSEGNPALVDQTNREGLRDTPEKQFFIRLLKHLLLDEFKPFLEACDRAAGPAKPITVSEIDKRVGHEEKRLRQTMKLLRKAYPKVESETKIISTVEDSIERLKVLMAQAREQVSSYKKTRDQVIHLAATGLLVEILAHELNRATRHTLRSLAEVRRTSLSSDVASLFSTLESQLKTIEKRLRMIDPLGQAARQTKETFDLVAWVREIVDSHREQFRRHNIAASIVVAPEGTQKLSVTMVKGMVVQVLENLLSNSVYWLKQKSKLTPGFKARIVVTVDVAEKTVSVFDNGPGVAPDRSEEIFEPHVTTKPAGEGKGLGLFIAREIARYHRCALAMSDDVSADGSLNTFVLTLGGAVDD